LKDNVAQQRVSNIALPQAQHKATSPSPKPSGCEKTAFLVSITNLRSLKNPSMSFSSI